MDLLREKMGILVNRFNQKTGYDLRLLNRLWGRSHYDKILLGCDGRYYLFEWVLVLPHKDRRLYDISGEQGINLNKRMALYHMLFDTVKDYRRRYCESCFASEICTIPLPLFIWCRSRRRKFPDYLSNFCQISRLFITLSRKLIHESRNELDREKLTHLSGKSIA